VSDDVLAPLLGSHPALIDSVVRWRGVGGWGAAATVLRAIDRGAVSTGVVDGSITLDLVPGVATPRRARSAGPHVERGHVEGLSHFDRELLVLLFDDMSHGPNTDLASLASYRNGHPLEFWGSIKRWRTEVDAEASRLTSAGRLQINRALIERLRADLVDRLHDTSISASDWSDCAGVALVAGLDDVVASTARERCAHAAQNACTGPAGVQLVCSLRSGRRSGVDSLRRFFSPWRPTSYPPAQYTKLVLPPWHGRPRFVDDGSQRIGG